MPATETNPFLQVYDALLALAVAHPLLAEMVRAGNRVTFGTGLANVEQPIKEVPAVADLPEIILKSNGIVTGNLHNTSSTSILKRRYSFIVTVGTYQIAQLLELEFYLVCALCNWKETLTALQWNDKAFVKNANLSDVSEGLADTDNRRKLRGWIAVWSCELDFVFNTAELIAETQA